MKSYRIHYIKKKKQFPYIANMQKRPQCMKTPDWGGIQASGSLAALATSDAPHDTRQIPRRH